MQLMAPTPDPMSELDFTLLVTRSRTLCRSQLQAWDALAAHEKRALNAAGWTQRKARLGPGLNLTDLFYGLNIQIPDND